MNEMIKNGEQRWSTLSFKDKSAYVTALASFFLGWILLFIGFVVTPLGEISGSVLSGFGIALVYTASVFGITLYFNNQMTTFKNSVISSLIDKMPQPEDKEETRP